MERFARNRSYCSVINVPDSLTKSKLHKTSVANLWWQCPRFHSPLESARCWDSVRLWSGDFRVKVNEAKCATIYTLLSIHAALHHWLYTDCFFNHTFLFIIIRHVDNNYACTWKPQAANTRGSRIKINAWVFPERLYQEMKQKLMWIYHIHKNS